MFALNGAKCSKYFDPKKVVEVSLNEVAYNNHVVTVTLENGETISTRFYYVEQALSNIETIFLVKNLG